MNRISTPGKLRQRMNVELFRMEAVQCERGLAGGGQISNPLWSGLIQTVNKIIQSLFQKSFHWVKMKVISNVSSSFLTMLVIFMKPLKVSTRQLLVAAWKDSPLCWSDAVWERTDTFCCCHQPISYHWHNKMKTQYKMFGQLIYLIFYLIFSTQNWLEIEILELQKEIVERTKLTNIFLFFCI